MRAGSINFFRPCLTWLFGSVSKVGGLSSPSGCCSYHLFYSPSMSSGLNHVSRSPSPKARLLATNRQMFATDKDRAAAALLRFARSAGRMICGRRTGRVNKALRWSWGPTRQVPSLTPNPPGLLSKLMY